MLHKTYRSFPVHGTWRKAIATVTNGMLHFRIKLGVFMARSSGNSDCVFPPMITTSQREVLLDFRQTSQMSTILIDKNERPFYTEPVCETGAKFMIIRLVISPFVTLFGCNAVHFRCYRGLIERASLNTLGNRYAQLLDKDKRRSIVDLPLALSSRGSGRAPYGSEKLGFEDPLASHKAITSLTSFGFKDNCD